MSIRAEDALGGDGSDLYVSFLQEDSSWSKPIHTGKVLNSVGNESAPFLCADDKTLFFSSDGFSGYGSDDIFMSRRLDDSWTKWSKPTNLGKNINTPQSDIFFTLPHAQKLCQSMLNFNLNTFHIERHMLNFLQNVKYLQY